MLFHCLYHHHDDLKDNCQVTKAISVQMLAANLAVREQNVGRRELVSARVLPIDRQDRMRRPSVYVDGSQATVDGWQREPITSSDLRRGRLETGRGTSMFSAIKRQLERERLSGACARYCPIANMSGDKRPVLA